MKTSKEIREIVDRLNAETNGEFRVYDCTPAWSLNYHICVDSRKHCCISLEAIDYSGFKDVYGTFKSNCGWNFKCNADDLYEYLLSLYNEEEARVALWNKQEEYKKQLADNEVLLCVSGFGKETEKAIQIKYGITIEQPSGKWYYNTYWLPKSQVKVVEEIKAVVVPKWLAKKNDIVW